MNCFQNCIFTYDSQQVNYILLTSKCCELLSELYFYLWFPTVELTTFQIRTLWIAFRIVFLLMIPNRKIRHQQTRSVVNCFQNCIFTYDSQHGTEDGIMDRGCELLSELYFYLWFPTSFKAASRIKGCELLSELYFYLWFPTRKWSFLLWS